MSSTINSSAFLTAAFYAFLGGVLPVLAWLFFWLRQDKKNPEPKYMIALAFIGGVVAVIASLYLEKIAFSWDIKKWLNIAYIGHFFSWLKTMAIAKGITFSRFSLVVVFAPIIEETTKLGAALFTSLRSKNNDEPIDPVIYMITTALGFAAIENMLFLIDPLVKSDLTNSILTGNMRFIGATLVHTICSAVVGMFIGFNFYDKKGEKTFWTILGLITAILLHSMFNFFIIDTKGGSTLYALEGLWLAVIVVLLLFERVKRYKKNKI